MEKPSKATQGVASNLFIELGQTLWECENGIIPTHTEFNYIGSRGSSKTYNILFFLACMFLSKKNNIIYICRETYSELDGLKEELFPKLEEMGFPVTQGLNGSYSAGKNTITNGYNKIIFKALNAEKMKVSKGKGAGLPVWTKADNIIGFFEEANQMVKPLIDTFTGSFRGNYKTNKIEIYASNPWDKENWYVKKIIKVLPESLEVLDTIGYQKIIIDDKARKTKIVYLRNNILTNEHLDSNLRAKLEQHKEVDINYWRISARGISGVLGNMVYANAMNRMVPYNEEMISIANSTFQGGVDWGYGASSGASPSSFHFLSLNAVSGIDVMEEGTLYNNNETILSTEQQIDRIILFFFGMYMKFKRPFKVFLDNQGNIVGNTFYTMFNDRLSKVGLNASQIEFLPARKTPISERILLTNYLLSNGKLRISPKCPKLIDALQNTYYIETRSATEGFKQGRNHDHTHWLNSGVEYSLGNFHNTFMQSFGLIIK